MQTLLQEIVPLQNWLPGNRPVIIAGPCSAESREQVMSVAKHLARRGDVSVFRAGVWKPRTRPGTFEGKGLTALEWLKEVKHETGLFTAVEVANAGHVEAALSAGVDILWIGARTTVNPFYVQEIADALNGTDIPVLVKNPLHPDTELWIGALERISRAGINRLAAVHRGWYAPVPRPYRNEPRWELAVELRLRYPGLPVLTDPSHISGRADMVMQVAQEALDLDMEGLMIEVHPDPANAMSDAAQQLSFKQFDNLMESLVIREPVVPGPDFESGLMSLRMQIDTADQNLIRVLAERMELVKTLGVYKRNNNLAVLQLERWKEIVRTRLAAGRQKGLDEEFVYEILQVIHKTSLAIQSGMYNEIQDPGTSGL